MEQKLSETDFDIVDLTTKLSGAILRKAELENDFEKIYSLVFQKMYALQESEGYEFLAVLGEIGG